MDAADEPSMQHIGKGNVGRVFSLPAHFVECVITRNAATDVARVPGKFNASDQTTVKFLPRPLRVFATKSEFLTIVDFRHERSPCLIVIDYYAVTALSKEQFGRIPNVERVSW